MNRETTTSRRESIFWAPVCETIGTTACLLVISSNAVNETSKQSKGKTISRSKLTLLKNVADYIIW
jgi:hypothetical protein